MPELRKHYFLDEYCIIAEERKRRPTDLRAAEPRAGSEATCSFCPGNEGMTPFADAVYTEKGVYSDGPERISGWMMRVLANVFPALVPDPGPVSADWTALPGEGYHEVIVDSPRHEENPADFSEAHLGKLISVYRDRYVHYSGMNEVKYVSVYKNWGREAGASMSHSHSQLIAMSIIPPLIKRELQVISSLAPSCPYCDIVAKESRSCRLIDQNEGWFLIAPFYSQAPYECWILPRRHFPSLKEMSEDEGNSLGRLLKRALGALRSVLNDPSYNCMIFQLPSCYHLNIRIQLVVSRIAGFEKGTGVYINAHAPETAAKELRQFL